MLQDRHLGEDLMASMNHSTTPNIDWALKENPALLGKFNQKYGNNSRFLTTIDVLLDGLRSSHCSGIQEKAGELRSLEDLRSVISELRIAEFLVRKGGSVSLISGSKRGGRPIPDFIYDFDGTSYAVEVTSLTEDTITGTIVVMIRQLFEVMPFLRMRIRAELKDELSTPRVKKEARHKQNLIVLRSLGEFIVHLCQYPFAPPNEIDTEGIRFSLQSLDDDRGYLASIAGSAIGVPTKDLQSRIAEDLVQKAHKRTSFALKFKSLRYLLAYDCGESMVDSYDLDALLYGEFTSLEDPTGKYKELVNKEWSKIVEGPSMYTRYRKDINSAAQSGWQGFLLEKHLIPNDFTYLSNPGIFLGERAMRNASAVLFRSRWGTVEFFPNPFSNQEINLGGAVPPFMK